MTEVDWEKLDELNSRRVQGVWSPGAAGPLPQKHVLDMGTPPEAPFLKVNVYGVLHSDGDRDQVEDTIEFIAAIANAFPAIKAERDAKDATIRALQEMNDGLRKALGKINAIEDAEYPLEDEYGYESCHVEGYNAGLSKCRETILLALKDTPNA